MLLRRHKQNEQVKQQVAEKQPEKPEVKIDEQKQVKKSRK